MVHLVSIDQFRTIQLKVVTSQKTLPDKAQSCTQQVVMGVIFDYRHMEPPLQDVLDALAKFLQVLTQATTDKDNSQWTSLGGGTNQRLQVPTQEGPDSRIHRHQVHVSPPFAQNVSLWLWSLNQAIQFRWLQQGGDSLCCSQSLRRELFL